MCGRKHALHGENEDDPTGLVRDDRGSVRQVLNEAQYAIPGCVSRLGLRPSGRSQVRQFDSVPIGYEAIPDLNVEVIAGHRNFSLYHAQGYAP